MRMNIKSGNVCSMQPVSKAISTCRHCRFYQIEGRRGGVCQQLEVPVQGGWKACSLAIAPFTSKWDQLSEIASRQLVTADPQATLMAEARLQNVMLPSESGSTSTMVEQRLLSVEPC